MNVPPDLAWIKLLDTSLTLFVLLYYSQRCERKHNKLENKIEQLYLKIIADKDQSNN